MSSSNLKLFLQTILNSPTHIDKNLEYNLLLPFIGTGLVTSSGKNCFEKIICTQKIVAIKLIIYI